MFSVNPVEFLSKRVIATLIDYTLFWALVIFYIIMTGKETMDAKYTVEGLAALIPILFWFIYFVICESFLDGTIGHQLLNLKIVTTTGRKPSFSQILVRRFCDAIEIAFCFGLIAFLIAYRNESSQRLGDILSKTIVIGQSTVFITS